MTSHFSDLYSPDGLYSKSKGSIILSEDGDLSSPPPQYSPAGSTISLTRFDIKEKIPSHDDPEHDDPDHIEEGLLDLDGELPRLVKEMQRRAIKFVARAYVLGMLLAIAGGVILMCGFTFFNDEANIPRRWLALSTATLMVLSGAANGLLGFLTSQWHYDVEAPVRPTAWILWTCIVTLLAMASAIGSCFVHGFLMGFIPTGGIRPYWILYTTFSFAAPILLFITACQLYGQHTLERMEGEFLAAKERLLEASGM